MTGIVAQFPEFRDRTVLITGGGSGIGAAIVEGFARQGAKVSFIDIAETESHDLVARLSRDTLHPVRFHKADLRDVAAIRRDFAELCHDFLRPVTGVEPALRENRIA